MKSLFIGVNEAAKHLGLSKETVYHRGAQGDIKGYTKAGSGVVFERAKFFAAYPNPIALKFRRVYKASKKPGRPVNVRLTDKALEFRNILLAELSAILPTLILTCIEEVKKMQAPVTSPRTNGILRAVGQDQVGE